MADFAPFIMDGVVPLPGNSFKVPVKMLQDTAVSQSFILEGVLPFTDESAGGSDVLACLSIKLLCSRALRQVEWLWRCVLVSQLRGLSF